VPNRPDEGLLQTHQFPRFFLFTKSLTYHTAESWSDLTCSSKLDSGLCNSPRSINSGIAVERQCKSTRRASDGSLNWFSEEIQQFENNYNNGNKQYLAHNRLTFLDRKVGSNVGPHRIASPKGKTESPINVLVPDKHQQGRDRVDHHDEGFVHVCPHQCLPKSMEEQGDQ
jgi:hypothetical protein